MARPDLTDVMVLVDVPDEERYRRLVERDGADRRPPMNTSSRGSAACAFDLIVRA
jgi:hypothetical protein